MTPEMFRRLAALGLSHEQMVGVLEIFEADAEARKEKVRVRVQKWREKKRDETQCNVTEHNATLHEGSHTRVEGSSSNLSSSLSVVDTSPPARSKRGERIPDDFEPDTEWGQAQGLSPSEASHEAAQFIDYWRAKPGKDGLKLDWPGTWRMWVRNSLKRRRSQPSTSPPRKQTVGQQARDELKRMGLLDAPDHQTRYHDEGDGGPGFAGTGIARRIALASSR